MHLRPWGAAYPPGTAGRCVNTTLGADHSQVPVAGMFNKESLPAALDESAIEYRHMKELGGLRSPRPDSLNTGWRNSSFRGYADYMDTPEFQEALHDLIEIGTTQVTAIMCAEAVPWRCHRSLVAGALLVRGIHVYDLMGKAPPPRLHQLTSFALVIGTEIVHPAEPA